MIKAVIFDLDNTLYDENSYFLKVFEAFSKIYNIDINFKEGVQYDERYCLGHF